MMQNGMNLNQAVSAVLAADKEGIGEKGAAEPPEGDDDVFQSEEVIAYRGINLHVIDTLLFTGDGLRWIQTPDSHLLHPSRYARETRERERDERWRGSGV